MNSKAIASACENGTIFSHSSAGGDAGIVLQGQASPRATPAMFVLVAGQMLDKPSMSTDHNVGSETIGTDDACVVG